MTTSPDSSTEWLSALADGELAPGAVDARLQAGVQSSALYSDWNSYQVIGQVIRDAASSSISADPAFLQRLNMRLAHEKVAPALLVTTGHGLIALPHQPAANEAVFRWKLVAGFASLAATLVVAWSIVGLPASPTGAQLAQNQPSERVVVASPQGPMVRDARLEELMAAHKQLGGSSLQAPSGFLRNAGFENSQSSRR